MAKMKTYAVEIEVVVKKTLYVEARRPGGAEAAALSEEGWRKALAYDDEVSLDHRRQDAKVVGVREV